MVERLVLILGDQLSEGLSVLREANRDSGLARLDAGEVV